MKKLKCFLIVLFLLVLILFFVRLINPREIDDVSPGIFCEEEYLLKSDVLWVIPNFEGNDISKNRTWCDYILSLNKILGLHGILHEYEEFSEEKTSEELLGAVQIFGNCFGFLPTLFKAPQLKIIDENKRLVKNNNLQLKGKFNQLTHKVYHCNDTGMISNNFINLF